MKNKKILATLSILRKIIETFSNFFFGIYLFKIVNGDFNFLLSYAAFCAISGFLYGYFLMKYINAKTAKKIFRLSFICEIISALMLLILKNDIVNYIWLFAAISRFSKSSYYAVFEVTLIRSAKNHSLSSFIAGVGILSSFISLLSPAFIGFLISDFSYEAAFILLLVNAVIATLLASMVDFKVIKSDGFHPIIFWKKALKKKTMREAYLATFLRRFSGTDGVLEYLLPVLIFMALGTEFSVGSFSSFFAAIYMVFLEVVRVFNKKGAGKRFYVPLSLLNFSSSILMISNFNTTTILIFYFTIQTGTKLIMTESASMLYAVGIKEKLEKYTREHQFTWNICLTLGNLVGILVAYVIYNFFYSQTVFALIIVILTAFAVLEAYLLQRVEQKLGGR